VSAEDSQRVRVIEAHQELIAHVEHGSSRMKALSAATVVVAALLAASYAYQIAYPLLSGRAEVTVNLTSPFNVAVELFVLALSLAWLLIGLQDYTFAQKLSRAIGRARAEEKTLEERITG